jgi:16S rRNA (uracil1498-N3)-methyltransferase
MTHRFWVAGDQLEDERVRFTAAQAHQIRSVLRLHAGDQVRVFDGVKPVDRVVELANDDSAAARIIQEAPQAAEPRTDLHMYPALLQRDKFELVLQKLTELGVAAITPILTARSLVREAPDDRRCARWRTILTEAAEQCGRGVVPELLPAQTLAAALQRASGQLVLAYEGERQVALREALRSEPRVVAVFVGPEGGYTPDEVDCARRAGAQVVSLGPRVLRAETATIVAATLVLYERGDLSWPE